MEGDKSSSGFVADYPNYLNYVSTLPGRNYTANGSILLPVDVDRGSALDYSKQATSEYLKIVESNREVPSTVPDSVAFAGGGKSGPDSSIKATASKPDATQGTQPKEPSAQANGAATSSETSAQANVAEVGNDASATIATDVTMANGAAIDSAGVSQEGQACGVDSNVKDASQLVTKVVQGQAGE